MNKTLLVIKNEIITLLSRRSFWILAIGVPLVSVAAHAGVSVLNRNAPGALSDFFSPPRRFEVEGYVDESGLIQVIPDSLPEGALRAYPDEAAARRALEAGEIAAYHIVPGDYVESGEIIYVRPDFNPLSAFDQPGPMEWLLEVNLLGGNEQLAARVSRPLHLQEVSLAARPQRDEDNPLTFFLPYAATLIFYVVILMSASFLLNSVTSEKESQVIEILMVSMTPRQLFTGKILGLGLMGLIQTVLWVGTGYALLRLSGRTFSLPAEFQLPVSFLVWGLIFFLLGYAVYASLMAGVGALVPNLREATQLTFVVLLPMMIPLFLVGVLIKDSNGGLATWLSLFPLTASVTMMMRLAAGEVPLWQPVLAAALLAVTAVFIVRAVAGLFRAQTLLSGQPFKPGRLLRALSGRR